MGRNECGIAIERLSIAGHRLLKASLVVERCPQVVVRFGKGRLDPKRLEVTGYRLLKASLLVEHRAQVVVRLGQVRLEPKRLLVNGNGLCQALRVRKRHQRFRQVVVGRCGIWLEANGLAETCYRLFELARRPEHDTQVVMRLGKIRIDPQGAREVIHRGLMPAAAIGDHTQQVQCVEVPGIGLQDSPEKLLRLPEVALLVMLHRKCQRLRNRDHSGVLSLHCWEPMRWNWSGDFCRLCALTPPAPDLMIRLLHMPCEAGA